MKTHKIQTFTIAIALALSMITRDAHGQNTHLDNSGNASPSKKIILKLQPSNSGTGLIGRTGRDTFASLSSTAQSNFINDVQSLTGHSISHVRQMWGRADVFTMHGFSNDNAFKQTLAQLQGMQQVRYAIEDARAEVTATPNDPLYSGQWHYFEEPSGMNLPNAWDITTGSSVTVAVVDTGYRNHPDLTGKILPGYDMITSLSLSADGDGRDSNPLDVGPRFIQNFGNLYHGTHVTGALTTLSNNNQGIAGTSWGAKILPVRALHNQFGGDLSDVVDAIAWAAGLTVPQAPQNNTPAQVINLSLASIARASCPQVMSDVINAAVNRGIFVVGGAGNNNEPVLNRWPANCNTAPFMVAAITRDADKTTYSNFGNTVDIAVPGGEGLTQIENGLLTLGGENNYVYMAGTSMSAPLISGLAALVLSVDPELTPNQISSVIKNNSRPFPANSTCDASTCGTGIADAQMALEALSPDPGSLIRMIASYVPTVSVPSGRQEFILDTQSSPVLSYKYHESTGNFQQRPGGACHTGQNNQSYFMIKIDSPNVQDCTFQGSWDSNVVDCNQAHLEVANTGEWVTLNTDRYEVNPQTCQLFQPIRSHVPFNTNEWFEVNLKVANQWYTRRMNFRKSN